MQEGESSIKRAYLGYLLGKRLGQRESQGLQARKSPKDPGASAPDDRAASTVGEER